MASLTSRSIAEGVGTLLLVYFGAGAAAITLMLAAGTKPTTPFNIGIGQLGGLGDWFAIGITFGIVIAAVIYALGRVSGAHINPGGDHCPLGHKTVPSR
jgi:glycerol uptake facilitator protein